MRWKKNNEINHHRIVKRFLVLPRKISAEVRWFETAYILQRKGWLFDTFERWLDDYWLDGECSLNKKYFEDHCAPRQAQILGEPEKAPEKNAPEPPSQEDMVEAVKLFHDLTQPKTAPIAPTTGAPHTDPPGAASDRAHGSAPPN